jgi:hypothetical protein
MGIKPWVITAALAFGSVANSANSDPFDYINPLIGTVNGGNMRLLCESERIEVAEIAQDMSFRVLLCPLAWPRR